MERDLGPGELEEWQAFHFFEPFGAPAEDDRWRILYTLGWQFNASKDAPPMPDWLDRDPEETARVRRITNLLTMEDDMESFFSSFVESLPEVLPDPPALIEKPAPVKPKRKPRKKPST